MAREDLPRFHHLRQWTPCLQRMLPAGTRLSSQDRMQQWRPLYEEWLQDGWDLAGQESAGTDPATGFLDYIGATAEVLHLVDGLPRQEDHDSPMNEEIAGIGFDAWAVTAEEKLFALFSRPLQPGELTHNLNDTESGNMDDGMRDLTATSSSDVVSLVSRKINKRWLKSPSRRRRPRPSAPSSIRVTTETCNLSAWTGPRRRRSTATGTGGPTTGATGSGRPAPKKRPGQPPTSPEVGATATASASGRPPTSNHAEATGPSPPAPLTMQEAVTNWLIWLNVMDLDETPARLLPRDIEHRILDNFMDLSPSDQLTTALALTSMIQQLMASIGSILQDAIRLASRSRNRATETIEVEVEPEEEDDEAGMMQTGMSSSWYGVLRELRQAFGAMSKGALRANIRWLQRRVHHRCTNHAAGYLLGHATGRAGELVAMLSAAMADTAEFEGQDDDAVCCTTWPCNGGQNWNRTCQSPADITDDEGPTLMVNDGIIRGPPVPEPVNGPPRHDHSPADTELGQAAEAAEAEADRLQREREQAAHEQREAEFNREMERIYEEHRASTYREWEEWVMAAELSRPAKRSRGVLQVVTKTGNEGEPGTSSSIHVPLDETGTGTLVLSLALVEQSPATPSTLPVPGPDLSTISAVDPGDAGVPGEPSVPPGQPTLMSEVAATEFDDTHTVLASGGGQLDPPLAALDLIYTRWEQGLISSEEVAAQYGHEFLHTLQVQRLAYFDGAVFHQLHGTNAEEEGAHSAPSSDNGD
ncbi:unnamed protein product [Symbiodinium sp. CCMP2592]|nr:unnamed protein product [Symbiodinium sp. CCMP2592]